VLAALLALCAAVLYAAASILQHRAAAAQPDEASLRLGLLTRLARRPVWLAGIVADVAGFGFQFAALAVGTLVVVQPILVLGILFALPVGALVAGQRVTAADVAAAVAVCAGLAVFLVVANPAPGGATATPQVWVALLAAGGGTCGLLALAGNRRQGRDRALLLSASTGVLYGVAAALIKAVGQQISDHLLGALGAWETYALIVVGVAGMVLASSAFQAGSLDVALPTMAVLDPVVSVLVGAFAFGESVAATPGALAAELAGLVLTAGGVAALARSQAVRAVREQRPHRS
jgi:drug/metabolite transporter (DMT)-like permease